MFTFTAENNSALLYLLVEASDTHTQHVHGLGNELVVGMNDGVKR